MKKSQLKQIIKEAFDDENQKNNKLKDFNLNFKGIDKSISGKDNADRRNTSEILDPKVTYNKIMSLVKQYAPLVLTLIMPSKYQDLYGNTNPNPLINNETIEFYYEDLVTGYKKLSIMLSHQVGRPDNLDWNKNAFRGWLTAKLVGAQSPDEEDEEYDPDMWLGSQIQTSNYIGENQLINALKELNIKLQDLI